MRVHDRGDKITFATEVSSPPGVPAAGAGVDISPMLTGVGTVSRFQRIILTASTTLTLTGPVEYGGEIDGVVVKLGELNGGGDIAMLAGKGHGEMVQFVSLFERFWLNPAAISAGNYSGSIEGVVIDR